MLIPPDVRSRLRGLRFESRFQANGRGFGRHLGRSRGAGLEFEQYRAYEPGDEPRRVDWKLYARSDRFFVRDATRESPLCVWTVLDASASMGQADRARPAYRKLDAAKTLAACIAEIATAHGDDCGLFGIGGGELALVPAGGGARHRDRMLFELDRIDCSGVWPDAARLRPVWDRIDPESLVVIVSDGLEPSMPELAARLAAARRQVLSIGLISCEERDFPFTGGFVFRDPETGAECRIDGAAARSDFLARFAQARAALARRLGQSGIRHIEQHLDEPADLGLRRLLARGPDAAGT